MMDLSPRLAAASRPPKLKKRKRGLIRSFQLTKASARSPSRRTSFSRRPLWIDFLRVLNASSSSNSYVCAPGGQNYRADYAACSKSECAWPGGQLSLGRRTFRRAHPPDGECGMRRHSVVLVSHEIPIVEACGQSHCNGCSTARRKRLSAIRVVECYIGGGVARH
jgi:hypothetical protein